MEMEREVMSLLRQATAAVRAAYRHALTDLALTPVQSTVLHLIDATPGSSSAELARRMHVTPQTMHKLVSDLEQRELLTLQPRPGHGRILDVHLTSLGQKLVADADSRAQAIEERMTAGLDTRQRQQLLELLQHCITALDMSPEDEPASGNPGTPSDTATSA
jgi:DNA-binding MarR family transcriptional regulator